ncbi:hypothetical protein N7495_006161 [Penicillium taxi]|uniref:uncharacterized protein n=1 Tax=Penicillium taxi TaxID=168475 RepID=UPI002545188B|nr:uncharacterized protein N7495_006161 [Penicillium taxi]KAJ5894470.1 hypothetical protein N7495_006161 [Penicillium taxi]
MQSIHNKLLNLKLFTILDRNLGTFEMSFGFSSAHPVGPRQLDGSPFRLYAYGDGMNGLSVFYADGQAQIGDISLSNATTKIPIYFTIESNSNYWVAHVDTTAKSSNSSSFQTADVSSTTNLLSLTKTSELVNSVSFSNDGVSTDTVSGSSTKLTNVWTLYGKYVLLNQPKANFYAKPTDKKGWYLLTWSTTVDASVGNTPVNLRTIGPLSS